MMLQAKALTSCLKFQGTRKKDMLVLQTPTQLADDIINVVIYHLPVVSNFRFKCVSKQWLFLNMEALKRKSQTSTSSGIFYSAEDHAGYIRAEYAEAQKDENEDSFIDGTLSFLPEEIKAKDIIIFDSCGGLLLLCGSWDEYGFCVCNPATKKWVKTPSSHSERVYAAVLDCNPLVSVHFNIILIDVCGSLKVFSSETGKWRVISDVEILPNSALLFKGLIFGIDSKRICGFDMEGNLRHRIDLPGLSDPKERVFFPRLGQSSGFLHFCYTSKGVVYLWKLVDYESGSWLLKNSLQIMNPENRVVYINFNPYEDDVVFVGVGDRWHSYNMQTAQKVEICSGVVFHRIYPYAPCYLDGLGNEVERKWTT